MSSQTRNYLKFGGAVVVILLSLGYLAYTGVQESKSYYVTIKELRGMGHDAYSKRLRVAGNVQPGSIKRNGTKVEFVLVENELSLPVVISTSGNLPFSYLVWGFVQDSAYGPAAAASLIMLALMLPILLLYWLVARRAGIVALR